MWVAGSSAYPGSSREGSRKQRLMQWLSMASMHKACFQGPLLPIELLEQRSRVGQESGFLVGDVENTSPGPTQRLGMALFSRPN